MPAYAGLKAALQEGQVAEEEEARRVLDVLTSSMARAQILQWRGVCGFGHSIYDSRRLGGSTPAAQWDANLVSQREMVPLVNEMAQTGAPPGDEEDDFVLENFCRRGSSLFWEKETKNHR